jgi:hypothetical protein
MTKYIDLTKKASEFGFKVPVYFHFNVPISPNLENER